MARRGENEFDKLLTTFEIEGKTYRYYDLLKLNDPAKYAKLPISIKVLLEAAVRNCDNYYVKPKDVEKILNWHESQHAAERDIPFKPARVLLQDLTGVAVVVDMAGMRDAYVELGGMGDKLNSLCQVDLVVDHSVQVDYAKTADALAKNQSMEFDRNKERFRLFKWATKSMNNFRIIPPGSGIVHQINLEYLAHVVFKNKHDNLLYPDSLVGADSHTVMINGLGIVGYGCGGIECEAVMLGQTLSMTIPEVVGFKLFGQMDHFATSTDLVLTITKQLRTIGVVGKFIEFYGPGVAQLSVADRATIANMCPEYGATVAFFPVDNKTIAYLQQTGRDAHAIKYVEQYLRSVKMFRSDFNDSSEDPQFSQVIELNLAEIVPSLSGPKRPHDRVPFADFKRDFDACLTAPVGFKGFGLKPEDLVKSAKFTLAGEEYTLEHGSIVIAAITSCTNTSNPSVMLGAGMLAKKAVELGLTVKPYIKTSLSPGSGVVTYYLRNSKVLPYLEKLGFYVTGYGCQTCIGNSGPLEEEVDAAIAEANLVCVGVLSGNRNFEGRIHSSVRANYLASPLLVVASAIAGKVIDFQSEPLGTTPDGKVVYLRDIWPTKEEIDKVEREHVVESMFREVYSDIERGNKPWAELDAPQSVHYPWDEQSNYLKKPFFFDQLTREPELSNKYKISGARALLVLGDSVSTDMISPAGSISKQSPAYEYLLSRGVAPKDINSYGSYRGNDNVMIRGTFANIRLNNKLVSKPGPRTVYLPAPKAEQQEDFIFNVAKRYSEAQVPLIVLAGKEYGCGSSRDWAAKGVVGLGVRAIIAESYERIHRSNLVGMSVLPLQFLPGQTAESLKLSGRETFTIDLGAQLSPGQKATVHVEGNSEGLHDFTVEVRFDTEVEIEYYKHGSILHYMLRQLL